MAQRSVPGHERQSALDRFEALLDLCERVRPRGLSFDELRELATLYRGHAAELARLRDRDADPDAIRHLNALCVRAYAFLYSSRRRDRPERREWLRKLPVALGRAWSAILVAWALLGLGGVVGGGLALRDPAALYSILPVGFGYSADHIDRLWSTPQARQEFFAHEGSSSGSKALFGSYLFTHNTQVGLLSFATGILAGIPTVLLQLYNGLVLGSFTALFARDPWPVDFAAWLLPHAIPELTAISLCCASGLLLGAAVAAPGRRTRGAALRDATSSALLLLSASVPLFVLAAGIESFVRESAWGNAPRLTVAAFMAALLAGALLALRRMARQLPANTDWLLEGVGPVARDPAPSAPRRGAGPDSD